MWRETPPQPYSAREERVFVIGEPEQFLNRYMNDELAHGLPLGRPVRGCSLGITSTQIPETLAHGRTFLATLLFLDQFYINYHVSVELWVDRSTKVLRRPHRSTLFERKDGTVGRPSDNLQPVEPPYHEVELFRPRLVGGGRGRRRDGNDNCGEGVFTSLR
jgi:hypothetical protein